MADGSISRRENIQFEALLDIYSEKLPELEKCIRKSVSLIKMYYL